MKNERLTRLEELDKLFSSYHNKKQENKNKMTTTERMELQLMNNQIDSLIRHWNNTLKDVLSMVKTYKGDDSNVICAVILIVTLVILLRINQLNKLKLLINLNK